LPSRENDGRVIRVRRWLAVAADVRIDRPSRLRRAIGDNRDAMMGGAILQREGGCIRLHNLSGRVNGGRLATHNRSQHDYPATPLSRGSRRGERGTSIVRLTGVLAPRGGAASCARKKQGRGWKHCIGAGEAPVSL
jgi:hypothetical protein